MKTTNAQGWRPALSPLALPPPGSVSDMRQAGRGSDRGARHHHLPQLPAEFEPRPLQVSLWAPLRATLPSFSKRGAGGGWLRGSQRCHPLPAPQSVSCLLPGDPTGKNEAALQTPSEARVDRQLLSLRPSSENRFL